MAEMSSQQGPPADSNPITESKVLLGRKQSASTLTASHHDNGQPPRITDGQPVVNGNGIPANAITDHQGNEWHGLSQAAAFSTLRGKGVKVVFP